MTDTTIQKTVDENATATTTTETPATDDFASMFDSLAREGDDAAAGKTPDPAAAAATTEPAKPAADDAAAGGEGGDGTEGQTGDEGATGEVTEGQTADDQQAATGEEGKKPATAAQADDPMKRLADLLTEKLAKPEQTQQPQQTQQQQQPQTPLTADEIGEVQNYLKEFPDQARANALIRRHENHALLGYVFDQVAQVVNPLMEELQYLRERVYLEDLKAKVPDYSDDLRANVAAWVGKQPKYLQDAYTRVIEGGDEDEVADLVNRYKADAGIAASGKQPTPAPVKKQETELPAVVKQAATKLAPVGSKRSNVVSGGIPTEDFGGAFEHFAKIE